MTSATREGYFGEYNHIYFLWGPHGLGALCDRARRKAPVVFEEQELIDVGEEHREPAKLFFGGEMPGWSGDEEERSPSATAFRVQEVAGRTFTLTRKAHVYRPGGFGRGLYYQVLAPTAGRVAVLLTVELPPRVRYSVRLRRTSQSGDTLHLEQGIDVTLMTSVAWRIEDDAVVVETGEAEGSATFLVESFSTGGALSDYVVVAMQGHERAALLARVACGGGFVPCFVVGGGAGGTVEAVRSLLADGSSPVVVAVGLPSDHPVRRLPYPVVSCPSALNSSKQASEALGRSVPDLTITTPDRHEAYGPALYLAVTLDANLTLDPEAVDVVTLSDTQGTPARRWLLSDLIGTTLGRADNRRDALDGRREVAICESTLADLLVCQAVGYAEYRLCDIAFLPPIQDSLVEPSLGTGATTIERLEADSAEAVPMRLRTMSAEVLTVFTRRLPLHMTPIPGSKGRHWRDRHEIAHLPRQIASVLVPGAGRAEADEPPPVSFGVIFDALGAVVATESEAYVAQLAEGLSVPVVLSGLRAQQEALQEVLQRLDTDLVVLIAHGERDHIVDAVNGLIPAALIQTWRLRGRPLIFNNSCTSWTSTGEAFLRAGAGGMIATLWPVPNDVAAEIGAGLARRLHSEERGDVTGLLGTALNDVVLTRTDGVSTAAAYIYVGLPGSQISTRRPVGTDETLALLTAAFNALYGCLEGIVQAGKPELAAIIHPGLVSPLRKRVAALVVPGEVPPHLPWPMSVFSALDFDFVRDMAELALRREMLQALPHESQRHVVHQMSAILHDAVNQLATWEERHARHLGQSTEDRPDSMESIPARALGEAGFLLLAA